MDYFPQIVETRFFLLIFISTLTFFSLVVAPGYDSFSADQTMFLPPLLQSLDPSLFSSQDLAHARMLSTEWSLVDDVLRFFVQMGIPLVWVLFLLSFILRISFFTALYHIIFFFTENRTRSAFILLFFLLPFFIPGTGHTTLEKILTYRQFSVTLSLVYIALYLSGWQVLSGIPLIFAFMLHAISALPFFAVHGLLTLKQLISPRTHTMLSSILVGLFPLLGAVSFILLRDTGVTDSFFLRIDEEWKQLANPRNAPAFFAFWDIRSYISLASWILLLGMPLLRLKELLPNTDKRNIFLILVVIAPLCLLAGAVIGELTSFYGIVKLNLQRGLLLISFFTPLIVGIWAFWHVETNQNRILENTFLSSVILWFLFKGDFLFLREQSLIFLAPLVILWYGRALPYFPKHRENIISLFAVMIFGFLSGAVTQRSLSYGDINAVIRFYAFLLGGFGIALYFYAKKDISSTSTVQYVVSLIVPIFIAASLYSVPFFTIYPAYYVNKPYQDACAWIGTHTPKDSIFIVEPFVSHPLPEVFRVACLRSIFTTYKEGGVVPYDKDREVAFEWKRKYNLIYELQKKPLIINQIKQTYKIDYVISETPVAFPKQYPLVFSNNAYFIYDIRN